MIQTSAIIFDMDGVVADTEALFLQAIDKVFNREFNITPTKDSPNWFDHVRGHRDDEIYAYLLQHYNLQSNLQTLTRKISETYHRQLENHINPMPGCLELIEKLKGDYRLALATSSYRADAEIILRKFRIKEVFEVIITGDDIKKGKPDPEIFLLAAERLRLPPHDCLVIEDSENGVTAAKSAGMRCIAVTNGLNSNTDFSKADLVLNSLEDVYPYLTFK